MTCIEQKYLDEFQYLQEKTYLDVACVAMQPERTLKVCRNFQDDFVRNCGQLCFGPYAERREKSKQNLAELIGCDPDEIVFTPNTTTGNCVLMNSDILKAGDSVVVSNYDFPSVSFGWYKMQEKGIRVNTVEAVNGCIRAEDVIAAIDENTKVVELTQVHNVSGYMPDLKKIGDVCQKRGILLSVDGIQALGRIPVNVREMGIDVYSCGGFKGLLGVLGIAVLYCSPRAIDKIRPTAWSDYNLKFDEEKDTLDNEFSLEYYDGIEKLEAGSLNNYGIMALGSSSELLKEIGSERIYSKIIELERYYRKRIAEEEIPFEFLGDADSKYWSGIVSGKFDIAYYEKIERKLEDSDVYASMFVRGGEGILRISLHYYNKEADIDKVIALLKEVF